MRINRIRLDNFRNYGRLDIDVGPSVNIVYGSNGEGKTNLIESIYVASCVTSHKTAKDRNLIKKIIGIFRAIHGKTHSPCILY